jgi:protein arginine kinase activator
MYICQICKKAPATIHLTDIHNNVKKEVHICEHCAEEKGFNLSGAANLPQLLGLAAKKMIPAGAHKAASVKVRTAERDLVCPRCGATWTQFGERGRLGCPHDYEAFAPKLRPLIAGQISGAKDAGAFHVGKKPGRRQFAEDRALHMRSLEKKLQQAIAEENYEAAAKLKTGIDELRKEGN